MRALLAKHWFLIFLTLGVGAALGLPVLVHTLTDFWQPRWAIAISLFLVAWTMPTQSLLTELRRPWPSLWAVFLSYGLVPTAGWLLGWLTDDVDVRLGLMLVSCVPCTLSSAVLWTRLAGGNEATALLAVMGTTFSSWFMTTAWLSWFSVTTIELDVYAIMLDLVLSLIVPTVSGQALRRIPACAPFAQRYKVPLGALSQGFVLAIVLKAGATVGDKLHEDTVWDAPQIFFWSVALAVLLHVLALVGGFFSARWLGFERGRQIAIAFASSQKTLPIALMLYEQYFKTDFPFAVLPLLFYHIGQLLLDTIIARRLRAGAHHET